MASKKNGDQKLADQANELYWRSDQSVNQIAEAMDLSKSGLYALIRPLAAEGTCPDCGEGLVFSNRTTEQKSIASCPACEYAGESRPSKKNVRTKNARTRKSASDSSDASPGTDLQPTRGASVEGKTKAGRRLRSRRVLWASVLLGVAAGLYVTRRSR